MSLRILEDRRRFEFHRMSPEERGRIVKLLTEVLRRREEVLLAVVFGGFTKYEVFRDVDVAVFTGYSVPYDEVGVYGEELSRELEEVIGLPIDVVILDYTPPWFRARALEGIVLVERYPALATRLKFKSLQEVRDIRAKISKLEGLSRV